MNDSLEVGQRYRVKNFDHTLEIIHLDPTGITFQRTNGTTIRHFRPLFVLFVEMGQWIHIP